MAAGLYKTLRAAEIVPGVKGIVVACNKFLRQCELSAEGDAVGDQSDLAVAIMDKVWAWALQWRRYGPTTKVRFYLCGIACS